MKKLSLILLILFAIILGGIYSQELLQHKEKNAPKAYLNNLKKECKRLLQDPIPLPQLKPTSPYLENLKETSRAILETPLVLEKPKTPVTPLKN